VAEDWQRGRSYLPLSMLRECGPEALSELGVGPLPLRARESLTVVTRRLLDEADRFYRSGDAGIPALPFQAALAVRAARLIYSAIGERILRADYDAYSMRAVVPRSQKLLLLLKAALLSAWELPRRLLACQRHAALDSVLRFPDDILPV